MTGLLIAALMAALTAIAILFVRRGGGTAGWEAVVAALLVGLAGYAWQGRPALDGSPRSGEQRASAALDERLISLRNTLGNRFSPGARWLTLSDGLARNGDSQDAVNILVSGVRAYPKDADLWAGLGTALVMHGGGVLSPAAEYAYQQALTIQPGARSALFFYGLSLAQNGQAGPARSMWVELLNGLPPQSPFRAELERNIATLDGLAAGSPAAPSAVP